MLSVIVNFHDMRREARRTLLSLSRRYQIGADAIDYEVLALDHGSAEPLSPEFVAGFGERFAYRFVETTSPSPVAALNRAVADASGEFVMVLFDGAHVLTPRMLQFTDKALRAFADPFVCATTFPLGWQVRRPGDDRPYDRAIEDELLASTGWEQDGYRLFRAVQSFGDDAAGWFGAFFESACFALRKSTFLEVGGYDERFQSRGGGLASLDFFQRMLARPAGEYVVLLGEATFHQYHGGTASNAAAREHPWEEFHAEYVRLRGRPFERVPRPPIYLGQFTPESIRVAERSAQRGLAWWREAAQPVPTRSTTPASMTPTSTTPTSTETTP